MDSLTEPRAGPTQSYRLVRLFYAAWSLLLATGILGIAATQLGILAAPADRTAPRSGLSYQRASAPLTLSGYWEAYEGLLSESALGQAVRRDVFLGPRPGFSMPAASRDGVRTYRLLIDLPRSPVEISYAIHLPPELRGLGASVDARAITGDRGIYAFSSRGGPVSIMLRSASGLKKPETGIEGSGLFLFGEEAIVRDYQLRFGALAAFIAGSFILGGLFMLALFLYWRQQSAFLAFSGFLLASGLSYAVEFSPLAPAFLPRSLDLEIASMTAATARYAALALFALTAWAGAKGLRKAAITMTVLLPPIGLCAAAILHEPYRAWAHAASFAWLGMAAAVSMALAARASLKGSRRARYALIAAAFPVAGSLADGIFPFSPFVELFSDALGLGAFSFIVALGLVRKIGDSLEISTTLSTYVESVAETVRRFIPKEFLEALDKKDFVELKLGDHVQKEMTIFFSDIRAFTELSEQLTVEENFNFINSYLSRMVPVVKANGGFVDKYVGDAILALFPGESGADAAIRTAIDMQMKIVEYNGHRAKVGYRPISVGVGIHTGNLMLGVVGVSDRMENTVIADAVNLASRLQAITKAFNISLAISEQTFKDLEDPGVYKYRFIGKVKVKGKAAPVSVFEIFDGIETDLFERKMKSNTFFEQGMLAYYQKDFSGAMYYFRRVLDTTPEDGAASFYLENCIAKSSL